MQRVTWYAVLVGVLTAWVASAVADIWLSGGQAMIVGGVAAIVDMLLFVATYNAVKSRRRRG